MIDFSKYTQADIQRAMLSQVSDDVDKRQGSMIQTAIGPGAWYLEGMYMLLDQVQRNSGINTAVGQSLDNITQGRGIVRKAATFAVRQGSFNIPIPAGSAFKTINGADSVIFISGDMISQEGEKHIYQMTCRTAGMIGNSYTGSILPITAVAGLTTASIGAVMIPGTEEETDNALRERYLQSFETANFGGNIASYRNEILSIEGVGAVQVYPAWKGGGTVLCSILSSQLTPASDGLVEKVQNIICPLENGTGKPSASGYGMAPIGAAVTITTAENLTLNISCKIQFAAKVQAGLEMYQKKIEEKIKEYLQTVCQTWGSAVKSQKIEYIVTVYVSHIVAAILTIPDIINVTDVTINGSEDDLILTETSALQQIPSLGTVIINGS
ncbi:baseplate J/gp47 family protein [Lachnospiraceae bacterium 62-35]